MSQPHDPYQPTTQLPVVEPRGVYRAANHRRTVLIAAAASLAVLLGLVVWLFSGDDEPEPSAVVVPTAAASTSAAAEPTEESEPSPSATSSSSPAPSPTTQRPVSTAELITALITVVDALGDEDRIDDADALTRRLEQAAERLERGDAKGASRKIDEFTERLDDIRDDEDVSDDAYELLRSAAARIKAGL